MRTERANVPEKGPLSRLRRQLPQRGSRGVLHRHRPQTTYPQKPSHRTETLYKQAEKRAEGCPEGAWLWRAGARLSMPPLVASFRYFLSIQEIPPPEVPGDDDKQCRQNVERERSGASPRKALALKRRTRQVVAFTPKHCTSRQENVPREVQRGHGFGARERDSQCPLWLLLSGISCQYKKYPRRRHPATTISSCVRT